MVLSIFEGSGGRKNKILEGISSKKTIEIDFLIYNLNLNITNSLFIRTQNSPEGTNREIEIAT